MRDGDWAARLREALRAPVSPLRGLAVLAATATLATALLGRGATPAGEPEAGVPRVLAEPVVVHVAGAVARAGVYRLAAGSRVADALAAAGGATVDADPSALNLARVLEDGEQLLLPSRGARTAAAGARRADGRLDLNRASVAELDTLPGIGPVLAARIVAHREQHGGFRAVRDLRRVQGIGERLYQSLAELVAV